MIIDTLIQNARAQVGDKKVADVRIGLGYTAVLLDDGLCGVAYTFRNKLGGCCGAFRRAGQIAGMSGEEVIGWAREKHVLASAVGLAAINAALQSMLPAWASGNVTEALDVRPSDTFGMVGNFGPILSEVRRTTERIFIFEERQDSAEGVLPPEAIADYLPQCDVVVVTATSIINHTIDAVLNYCKNARQVAVTGPSTPLCPSAFQESAVTLLAGSVVTNPALLLQIVSEGGGTPTMRPATQQVLVRI